MKARKVLRVAGQLMLACLVTAPMAAVGTRGWAFVVLFVGMAAFSVGGAHAVIGLAGRAERRDRSARCRADRFYAGTDPRYDAPTVTRRDAFAAGLPWMERDGTLTWPPPTPEQTHVELHARRMAAEDHAGRPEMVHVPGVGWTSKHLLRGEEYPD